ncbi:hypothetical protein [Chryseobacterium sp.]|uniref:hypothetical protein n=1 Tax=Chryseobacterium sp. TaxID=1871047 RepID=UPI002FC86073
MKKVITLGAFLCYFFAQSQIGINTPNPRATLDIAAKTSDGSSPEGVIFPKLTGDEIKSADVHYGADQVGAIIFATSGVSSSEYGSKTENINIPGYYYFDGAKWIKMEQNSWNIEGNNGTDSNVHFIGTTDDQDLIFKRNNYVSGVIGQNITSFGYQNIKPDVDPGSQNVAFGHGVLSNLTSGEFNTGLGSGALHYTTTGSSNVGIGKSTLSNNTVGISNIAIGHSTMVSNVSGFSNIGIGEMGLWSNMTGSYNIAIGRESLKKNEDGIHNVAIGHYAGNESIGSMNTFIGELAGRNITGSGNVIIGFNAKTNSTGDAEELNNRLVIASGSIFAPPLIDGDFSAQTLKTNGTFEINNGTGNGAIKIVDGTQGAGKVLTSNADGVGTWQSQSPVKTIVSAYTITSTDNKGFLYINSNANISITVPDSLPVGFSCELIQKGVGQIVVTAGNGVTINSAQGLKSRTQYSVIKIILENTTSGIITGDTAI